MVKIFNQPEKKPTPTDIGVTPKPNDNGQPSQTMPSPFAETQVNEPITESQVEGPAMNTVYTNTNFTPAAPTSLPPATPAPEGYDPKALARTVNQSPSQDSGLFKPQGIEGFTPKQLSKAIATGQYPTEPAATEPFKPAQYNPQDMAMSDNFDSVYGDKPGFVSTNDPDGGFWDYARSLVTPEQIEEQRRENRSRLGILALGDAIRQFGNIYHTTKGAPSQTLNNPVEEEWKRQEAKSQRLIAQLQENYKTHMQQLEKAAQRAEKQREFDVLQGIRLDQQRATEEYRRDSNALKLKLAEMQDAREQRRMDETERWHDMSNRTALTKIYYGGGRGGGGGSRRGGGGGRYRVSGGGSGSKAGNTTTSRLSIPKQVTTSRGTTVLDTPGKQNDYVKSVYDALANKGLVEKGKRNRNTQLQEIESRLDNPDVLKVVTDAGLISSQQGSAGNAQVYAGADNVKGGFVGQMIADAKKNGSGSSGKSAISSLRGQVKRGSAWTKGANVKGKSYGQGQSAGASSAGQKPKQGQSSGATSSASQQGKRNAAVASANNVYASKDTAQYNGGRGNTGGRSSSGTSQGRSVNGSAARGNAEYSGSFDHYRDGRTRTSQDYYGTDGDAGKFLNIPTEVRSPKTNKWKGKYTKDTLRDLYNAFVKKGWVGTGANTLSDMVDAIYDNIDNPYIQDTLDLLEIRYNLDYNPDYNLGNPDNFE